MPSTEARAAPPGRRWRRSLLTVPLMLLVIVLALANVPSAAAASLKRTKDANHAHLLAAQVDPATAFDRWARHHNKPYAFNNDASEYQYRKSVWLDNLEYANQYNSKHKSHWLGMNNLADLTPSEFKQRYLGYNPAARYQNINGQHRSSRVDGFTYEDVPLESLAAAIDWRHKKAVTEVKNQGMCGSCWAFATTGAIEGINAIKTGKLVSLSEQELVECDRLVDMGCSGGMMDNAYDFIAQNGGLDTEEDWPYLGMDGVCDTTKQLEQRVVSIDGYQDVPPNSEAALKKAVAHQPVAVAVEADSRAFQLYVGGVLTDISCGEQLNHGVLVVGYGKDEENGDYWIIKNSWSSAWGYQGYINIQMGFRNNITGSEGLCGITQVPSYPVKHSPNPPTPKPKPPTPQPEPKPPAPPPEPQPVTCDTSHECPAGSTCCCLQELLGMCFSWGCCPMVEAVCCNDHMHCCPQELPVCDVDLGRCMAQANAWATSQPWATKQPATPRRPSLQRDAVRAPQKLTMKRSSIQQKK